MVKKLTGVTFKTFDEIKMTAREMSEEE